MGDHYRFFRIWKLISILWYYINPIPNTTRSSRVGNLDEEIKGELTSKVEPEEIDQALMSGKLTMHRWPVRLDDPKTRDWQGGYQVLTAAPPPPNPLPRTTVKECWRYINPFQCGGRHICPPTKNNAFYPICGKGIFLTFPKYVFKAFWYIFQPPSTPSCPPISLLTHLPPSHQIFIISKNQIHLEGFSWKVTLFSCIIIVVLI